MRVKFFVLCMVLVLSGCQTSPPSVVHIATAANVQFAMEVLTDSFTQQTGIATEIILNSSGKLTAQIQQGAPYDVLVSANMKYPNALYENGLAVDKPRLYAYGNVVMWSASEQFSPSWSILETPSIHHIAIANPKTAPYGEASIEALTSQGIYEAIEEKLVYGESISQTNQFILSQSAEIGFTSQSVVVSSAMKDKGTWIAVDPAMYSPIEQGVVLIQRGQSPSQQDNARAFYEFLFTPTAQTILAQYGYRRIPK